jgi:hypothetical protein
MFDEADSVRELRLGHNVTGVIDHHGNARGISTAKLPG